MACKREAAENIWGGVLTIQKRGGQLAQCKYCRRKGFFLTLNEDGLCKGCEPIIASTSAQIARILQESIEIINKSKNLDTKLSRIYTIIDRAELLLEYEKLGIPTITPSPSEVISQMGPARDLVIMQHMEEVQVTALQKADTLKSSKAKINALMNASVKIREHMKHVSDPTGLAALLVELDDLAHHIQLDGFLEAARKAEFKNQKKKALDQYYEALYFLMHDDIPDEMQIDQIDEIKQKITELGGEVE